ncbi:hypothetical protein AHAS_Ahas09G0129900 [Arachis hypogaea]
MHILTIMFSHTFGCCACRRTYKIGGCDLSSTAPPCTRWIEMMAPIFSRAAWHCGWYMIQVD